MPPKTSLASLDAGDERGVGAQQRAELALRQSSSSAKRSESAPERELILLGRRCIDGSFWPNLCYPPTIPRNVVPGHLVVQAPGVAPRVTTSRHASQATSSRAARLPCQSSSPGASNHKEEP
jgi:hypothetical protein